MSNETELNCTLTLGDVHLYTQWNQKNDTYEVNITNTAEEYSTYRSEQSREQVAILITSLLNTENVTLQFLDNL